MTNLSWNEIRANAIRFQKEWEHETNEAAEAKSFWDQFFGIIGVSRRRVAFLFELYKEKELAKSKV